MRTEVTVRMFTEHASKAGVKLPRQPFWNTNDRPVVNVTWDEARRLSTRRRSTAGCPRKPNGNTRRAAMPSTREDCPWGPAFDWRFANGIGRRAEDRWVQAAPAASFPPSNRGLFDMIGNVWEWTADRYQRAYFGGSPREDPQGPRSGDLRVARGGSWDSVPRRLQLSVRTGLLGVWPSHAVCWFSMRSGRRRGPTLASRYAPSRYSKSAPTVRSERIGIDSCHWVEGTLRPSTNQPAKRSRDSSGTSSRSSLPGR